MRCRKAKIIRLTSCAFLLFLHVRTDAKTNHRPYRRGKTGDEQENQDWDVSDISLVSIQIVEQCGREDGTMDN